MYVNISGWQTAREIVEENGKVLFEVAKSNHHCEICEGRIRHVRNVIARKNLAASFTYRPTRYGQTLFVALDAQTNGKDVLDYVAETLEIPIIR